MSQTTTPDGAADHREDRPDRSGRAMKPVTAATPGLGSRQAHRALPFVAGGILCVMALVFLAGGGWALWKDRVDRDGDGFVSFGTTALRTEQHAIVGDLRGDGPSWLYGSNVLGDTRVRATSQNDKPLFVGIAQTAAVFRYLRGVGYATVSSFDISADTTHAGAAPDHPPEHLEMWATSTRGVGRQTLTWAPRDGDWSVVIMNADGSDDVDVRGDASAELPLLPWVAYGLLFIGAAAAVTATWILVRAFRRSRGRAAQAQGRPTGRLPASALG